MRQPPSLYFSASLKIQPVQRIHQVIQFILRPLLFAYLAFGDADRHADGVAAVSDRLGIALGDGLGQGVLGFAAEQLGEVDLEAADGADRGAGDGGRLVVGEHDGVFGADPAAGGAATLAIVLIIHQDAVEAIHAVDAEQAKIDALHAIGAAAVIDDRIPAAGRGLVK